MRLHFDIEWKLQIAGKHVDIPASLFDLLTEIAHGKNLREAAEAVGISYRNAWGQIEDWEKSLDTALVIRQRGRGTSLTPFAESLLEFKTDLNSKFRMQLDSAAESASGHLTRMLTTTTSALRIVTSHHEKIAQLVPIMRGTSQRRVTLDVIGSEAALRRYQRADADICGFHIPNGSAFQILSERMLGWLDEERDKIFFLEQRSLGLMSKPTDPVTRIGDLASKKKYRFVNRQQGSATRMVFDTLLSEQQISPSTVTGYENEEHTHTAIAALIASGNCDVGFGEAGAAKKFALAFTPIVSERFYLSLKRELQASVVEEISAFFHRETGLSFEETSIASMREAGLRRA